MAQSLGIVDIVWKGKRIPCEKGAKFKPGGLKNNTVMTGRRIDRSEEFMAGEVSCTTLLLRGQSFLSLYSTGEGELQVLCDTGQSLTWTNAFGAYKLWQNWEPIAGWFTGLWNDLRTGMQPQVDWLLDVVGALGSGAVAQFRAAWEPLKAWFTGLWEGIREPFDSFINSVLGTVERVRAAFASLLPAQPAIAGAAPALGGVQGRQADAAAARAAETRRIEELARAGGSPGASARVDGTVTVEVAAAPAHRDRQPPRRRLRAGIRPRRRRRWRGCPQRQCHARRPRPGAGARRL